MSAGRHCGLCVAVTLHHRSNPVDEPKSSLRDRAGAGSPAVPGGLRQGLCALSPSHLPWGSRPRGRPDLTPPAPYFYGSLPPTRLSRFAYLEITVICISLISAMECLCSHVFGYSGAHVSLADHLY